MLTEPSQLHTLPSQALAQLQQECAPGLVQARQALLASKNDSAGTRRVVRYGFRVGSFNLLIAQGLDCELLEPPSLAPIPLSAPCLLGYMNRRGRPVPVFDLLLALDLPSTLDISKSPVLVLGQGERALGLIVQEPPVALRDLRPTMTAMQLPDRMAPFAQVSSLELDQLWIEFDHAGFFAALVGVTV